MTDAVKPWKYPAGRSRIVNTAAHINTSAEEFVLTPAPDEKVRRRNRQIEHAEQVAYFTRVEWARRQGLPGAKMIFAIPNGTVAGAKEGAKMVASGVKRGVPDIMLAAPRWGYHGLFIEMKQPDGVPSDVSPEQRQWIDALTEENYRAVVCYGFARAWLVTVDYLGWDAGKTHLPIGGSRGAEVIARDSGGAEVIARDSGGAAIG